MDGRVFLTKRHSKWLGGLIILIGLLFLTPPFIPSPDDFLNIFAAIFLVTTFKFSHINALIFTYTVIPVVLIIIGVQIYPERNGKVYNLIIKKIRKLKNKVVVEISNNPMYIVVLLSGMYIIYKIYEGMLQYLVVT